jgi:nitroreductase/NAD-dependent dihydropyrimidine dehydrogenase PreA subunit
MELFTVNPQTCNRDGICAAVCPLGIIDWVQGALPRPTDDADAACIRCGHCVAVCPTGSLSHRDMALEDCPPLHPELRLSPEQGEHFLRARRSIRVYRDTPVPQEMLARLIDMARYAPSGINSQGARWLVLGDRQELRTLAGIVIDWMGWMQTEMPAVARTLHLDRTQARWHAGHDVILRGAPAVIVAHAEKGNRMAPTTCTIALTYLELAATFLGLGGCWAGYFNAAANTYPPMAEALGLPEGHQCYGAMMVGYPKFSYHRLPTRNIPQILWRMG